ncbi:RNA-binding cell elongation regulator Jag/EloR [Peptococcus simiae]|uniref:RNA-binding cell elongation regulator Jag/EloR n=1 Tax=Peptococcus simiae TaxID=1643805 RepID=UPI0039814358
MRRQQFTGKTLAEAVATAARELGLSENALDYTVLEKASKGFLGFGAKEARIEVALPDPAGKETPAAPMAQPRLEEKEDKAPEAPQAASPAPAEALTSDQAKADALLTPEDIGLEFLAPIFEALEVNPTVEIQEDDDQITFAMYGEEVGILIGRRGDTLNALQFLLSLAINRRLGGHKRVILDCEDYRTRRADTLSALAHRMADKARETGRRVSLDPMNAAERRLVHLALEKEPDIKAESYGEDPHRKIVIYPQQHQ